MLLTFNASKNANNGHAQQQEQCVGNACGPVYKGECVLAVGQSVFIKLCAFEKQAEIPYKVVGILNNFFLFNTSAADCSKILKLIYNANLWQCKNKNKFYTHNICI